MITARNPFDRGPEAAAEYDAWYDSPFGRAVLLAELRCVHALLAGAPRPWLDLGTGSGRFGAALHAEVGLDPAPELLRLAAARLPSAVRGVADALPFRAASVGAVLAITVFEFLPAPAPALSEIARVLQPGGRFVLGFFPAASAWARAYREQGRDPTSVFHEARFFSIDEIHALAARAGLRVLGARSTLLEGPDRVPAASIVDGADPAAGFVAAAFAKPGP